ncbi:hypothetical protein J6590_067298 [Homalodisca vitripennis]|nr:hypothetical protein J6590_067298 [Homalodisca vitripennis]
MLGTALLSLLVNLRELSAKMSRLVISFLQHLQSDASEVQKGLLGSNGRTKTPTLGVILQLPYYGDILPFYSCRITETSSHSTVAVLRTHPPILQLPYYGDILPFYSCRITETSSHSTVAVLRRHPPILQLPYYGDILTFSSKSGSLRS